MEIRSTFGTVATLLIVGLVVAMVIGQQLGQPIVLGFVVTGSMAPTLQPGDGFVAIPPALAGEVEQGDVVTFEAQQLQGGGLTTHRIVRETPQGYITRGDANPFTDQDGPEPPVQESQIKAVAWQPGGELLVIPYLGTVSMAIQGGLSWFTGLLSGLPGGSIFEEGGFGSWMMGGGILILLYSFVGDIFSSNRGRDRGERSRSRGGVWRASVVLGVILLLIVGPATASMVLPSGTTDTTIVSSQSPSESPTVIQVGGSQEIQYEFSNDGYIPRVVFVESASTGVEVSEGVLTVSHGQTEGTTVTLYAPDETGAYVRSLSETHYIHILPLPVIQSLHNIHQLVAVLVIDLLIIGVVTIIFAISVGFKPLRFRNRSRNVSTMDRVRRKVRKWL